MTINFKSIYQFFKYTIYVFLMANVYFFFTSEFAASAHQFSNGIAAGDLIEAFAATIDTAAWVVLLLMFELETYVLDDRQFTRPVTMTLHSLRALCYIIITYALYGYILNLVVLFDVSHLANVTNLCSLATDNWVYATTLDEFTAITTTNCGALSGASSFLQFDATRAVVDASGLQAIRLLAWVDVINAAVWLLVVVVLEFDVRMQEKNRMHGVVLRVTNIIKIVLYSLLLLAAIYWGVAGDFIDFWDAFLWLVAFVFIELNVFEWRQEDNASAA